MKHSYRVEGMTCNSCVAKVGTALKSLPEVTNAEVTLNPPSAVVGMRKHISTEELNAAVSRVGNYSIKEVSAISPTEPARSGLKAYFPLILIAAYLLGGVLLRELYLSRFELDSMMINFMGGFFVIFSFFKLLDLKGFAEGYSTYDVVAQRWPLYGFAYPFIELSLGIMYLLGANLVLTNVLTIIVMGVSSVGVIQTIRAKRQFQCACLGTIFKLPLTKITLVEDLLMVGMAALMLFGM
jgi:copper chaperone CopZ